MLTYIFEFRWVRPDLSPIGGQSFIMMEIPTGLFIFLCCTDHLLNKIYVHIFGKFEQDSKQANVMLCPFFFISAAALSVEYLLRFCLKYLYKCQKYIKTQPTCLLSRLNSFSKSLNSFPFFQDFISIGTPSCTCITNKRFQDYAEFGFETNGCS